MTEKERLSEEIRRHRVALAMQANTRYNKAYDNALYIGATVGKSISYTNALIDEALALCGHPRFLVSFRRWSRTALEFLSRFTLV